MQWNRWYVTKSYLNSALWIVPLVALILENVVIRLVFVLHNWLDWIPWFGTTVTGATEALNTVESLTTAFIVFTFGSVARPCARGRYGRESVVFDAATEMPPRRCAGGWQHLPLDTACPGHPQNQ